jgi:carboxymethylenebutenolidase
MEGYGVVRLLPGAIGLAALVAAPTEARAAGITIETVEFPSGDLKVRASLARPDSRGKHPAVLVIHENRGLNEHIRNITRRFAMEGFVALAPDLLSRTGGAESVRTVGDAADALGSQPVTAAMGDLTAAFEYLRKREEVDPQRISSVGFGWGGWRSFMLATEVPELYRAVVFYGASPDAGFEKIKAPVLAHYGEWDYVVSGNRLWTADRMAAAGKKFQSYIYPESDAAFFNDTGPKYNAAAAKLAWERTLEFLRG